MYAENDFEQVCKSFGYDLLNKEFGSTPRQKSWKSVYNDRIPAHQSIPLHNEQAYTNNWPKIWFFGIQAARLKAQHLLQIVAKFMHNTLLFKRFAEKQLQYVRNYGAGLDVSWQDV